MRELEDFIEYLITIEKAKENTVKSYKADIDRYFIFLIQKNKNFRKSTKGDLNAFLDLEKQSGKSQATVSRCLSSIKKFYGYLYNEKNYPVNVARNVKTDKYFRKTPDVLTREEIELLLIQPDMSDYKGRRDKAMLELLYATGIKASELISLDVQDINTELNYITVRSDKPDRLIPIHEMASRLLEDYMKNTRKLLVRDDEVALFVNIDGKRITRQGFWKVLKKYGKMAGLTKEITLQTIRHSFTTHLIENGADLKTIQMLLGHSALTTTQSYSYMLKINKQLDAYKKYHPKSKSLKVR